MAAQEWVSKLKAAHAEVVADQRRQDVSVARYNLAYAEARVALTIGPGEALDVFGDGTVKAAKDCTPPPGAS